MSPYVERLVQLLSKLPGIGPRHATRIVLALLDKPDKDVSMLAAAIAGLRETVRRCRDCFNISEGEICSICKDPSRKDSMILAVERVSDLQSIERSGLWQGRYLVVGTIEPGGVAGTVRMRELRERATKAASSQPNAEVVLAMGADAAGEATALFALRELSTIPNLRVTRLARGLASGSHVEYADELTLQHALESRK